MSGVMRTPRTAMRPHAAGRRWCAVIVAAMMELGVAASAAPMALADGSQPDLTQGNDVLVSQHDDEVAPGLDLTSFKKYNGDANRWVTGNVLVADTTEPTLSMDLVDTGSVAAVKPVSQQIAGDTSVVAAVNSDFFDMNASNAPVDTNVSSVQGVRSIAPGAHGAITVSPDGATAIQELTGTSSATFGQPSSSHAIAGVNTPNVPSDGLNYYTSAWGTWPLGRMYANAANVHAAWIKDGTVQRTGALPDLGADLALGRGESVLVGSGASAGDAIAGLHAGDPVDVTVGLDKQVSMAAGGGAMLIRDGNIAVQPDTDYKHARMTAGISKDGTRLYLLEVDGNQSDGPGLTLEECAQQLKALGAWNAINLDGGGSATMIARTRGTTAPRIINRPSDGNERAVSNALVFRSSASATTFADARITPAIGGQTRVLQGLTRTWRGSGVAQNGQGLDIAGDFTVSGNAALDSQNGAQAVIRGTRHGSATVTFAAQGAQAKANIDVLGPIDHASVESSVLSLKDRQSTSKVTVTGYDADGYDTVVEPRDITVTGGNGVVNVVPQGDGTFLLSPTTDSGAATLTYTIGNTGVTVQQAVTVGLNSVSVFDFADAASWTSANDRASGSVEPVDGPRSGTQGLRLQYDFTKSTATRGFYAVPPQAKVLDGQPQMLTMWIKGDGSGAWPRIQLLTGDGVTTNINGPNIDWTGWKQVSFPIPEGTSYPLTLQRIRFMEIRSTVEYHGDIAIADLEETVAPDTTAPDNKPVRDPVITTGSSDVNGRPLRIAVMSDAQFVARDPNGPNVGHARRTIREIAAAKPDLMVIDGDFVDEGSKADLEFAKKILDEEVPKNLPYLYVPGNHEAMGDKDISVFERVIGKASTTKDIKNTRVITLDSSDGTLHGQGVAQLRNLEQQLNEAASDSSLSGVVLFTHMPIDDFLPSKNSQLGDRTEAEQLRTLIERFYETSGKSIAMINGHVGAFNATSFDGVSQITNGNSGKGPASTPDNGGFIGWEMLGINPSSGKVGAGSSAAPLARLAWMRSQTNPQIDAGSLKILDGNGKVMKSIALREGSAVDISGSFTQESGERTVPAQWPVSYVYSGDGLAVDDGIDNVQAEHSNPVVRIDSRTGRLTAVRAGTAKLTIAVNGQRTTVDVKVTSRTGGSSDGAAAGGQDGTHDGGTGQGSSSAAGRKNEAHAGRRLPATGADVQDAAVLVVLASAVAVVLIAVRRRL